MLNQVSVEALYSATYVENYLDCVENLPDDLQRLLSRMRELDIVYLTCVRDVKKFAERLRNVNIDEERREKTFKLMQATLITAQEQGDEKMGLLQTIQDLIENKTRLLDRNHKNLDFGKDEPPAETKEQPPPVTNNTSSSSLTHTERPAKRPRRARHDTFSGVEPNQNDNGSVSDHVLRSQVAAPTGTAAGAPKKNNTGAGKKKKRKARGTTNNSSNNTSATSTHREETTPPREEEPAIDPDEPTYCLCDQISYGEMIMCDNDLCPIEWFHFSCVTLTTKPKGKWFCPKCRGDRANVMKPKQQFLRELERYNKEKEEKT